MEGIDLSTLIMKTLTDYVAEKTIGYKLNDGFDNLLDVVV